MDIERRIRIAERVNNLKSEQKDFLLRIIMYCGVLDDDCAEKLLMAVEK